MREKEQQQNMVSEQKKALIGNGIILFVAVVGIILAAFAWFTVLENTAKLNDLTYYTPDDLKFTYSTQIGTLNSDGTITYSGQDLNNENLAAPVTNLMPGDTVYYRTRIYSAESDTFIGKLYLNGIKIRKELNATSAKDAAITFGTTDGIQPKQPLATGTAIPGNSDYVLVNTQLISNYVVISPGYNTIDWYFKLNGDAYIDNSIMNTTFMEFSTITFKHNDQTD